jgi:hypothetical protein
VEAAAIEPRHPESKVVRLVVQRHRYAVCVIGGVRLKRELGLGVNRHVLTVLAREVDVDIVSGRLAVVANREAESPMVARRARPLRPITRRARSAAFASWRSRSRRSSSRCSFRSERFSARHARLSARRAKSVEMPGEHK